MKRAIFAASAALLVSLAGCNEIGFATKTAPIQECFLIAPNNGNQPFSPILLDKCTGKSRLLVRSPFGDKPQDGYTYQWLSLEKNDYRTPHLVNN